METKKTKLTRAGVALAMGLSGCGVERAAAKIDEPPSTPPDRAALEQSVQDSLERLRALDLFTVDRMVLKMPANAGQCYGPCPGDDEAYQAELERQAKRLSSFVDQAQQCNTGHCYLFTPESGAQALSALNALEIVQVSSLVSVEPKNNPSCYNVPCAEDLEAAKVENRRREVMAFTIANYSKAR